MGGLVGDFAEWAVRKAAETVVDVFDIGGASGNNGGSSDWEAWGHPEPLLDGAELDRPG